MQVEIENLPEGWTLLDAAVCVKAIDREGVVRLASRFSPGLTTWECLGMLTAVRAALIDELNRDWHEGDNDA